MGNQDGIVATKQNCSRKKLWEELPAGPLIEIAKLLNYYEDFEALFMVCSTWYTALRKSQFKFLGGDIGCNWPVPWLLLAERQVVTVSANDTETPHHLCTSSSKGESKGKQNIKLLFYMLSSQRVREWIVKLPCPLEIDLTEDCYILSCHGWLLVVSNKWWSSMFMFSPFCSPPHNYIPLPDASKSFAQHSWKGLIKKFALSNPPSKEGCGFFVAILYDRDQLVVWTPGDIIWTRVDFPRYIIGLRDITFFQGQFYVFGCDEGGCILRFSPDNKTTDGTIIAEYIRMYSLSKNIVNSFSNLYFFMQYMVVLPCDKLLVVVRQSAYPEIKPSLVNPNYFKVFEIVLHPQGEEIMKEVNTLGNVSLFVGLNQSFSIEIPNDSHCFYGCKPNRIYFTEDFQVRYCLDEWSIGKYMGVYNMADGSIEQHFKGQSHSFTSPPLWLQPCSYA